MREILNKLLMISVLLIPMMIHGEDIKAKHGLELIILATQHPGKSDARVFRLNDGDPLESSGGFRIKLKSQISGKLQVKFISSQGESMTLRESIDFEKGDELFLPDKKKWYTLDRNTGIETIIFELDDFSGASEKTKFKIQHINTPEIVIKNLKEVVKLQNVDKKKKGKDKYSNSPFKSISLRSGSKLLDRINSQNKSDEILSRGIGSWIYRKYSHAVVFLATDSDGMSGSGFILNNGDIVTNWHVINGFEKVAVYLKSDIERENYSGEFLVGKVVKFNKFKDLALVKVVDFSNNYQSVDLGELKDIEIGDEVHAIGHPNGGMLWTYTKGNISGYLKDYEWQLDGGPVFNQNVIQTQTPINPGNSGGPLFNNNGKLIGIMTWSATKLQLMNFAVAVDEIRSFLNIPQKEYRTSPEKKPEIIDYDDLNKDGKRDVLSLDTDHNGIPDRVLIDKDYNGTFEFVILDDNENQTPDGVGFDTDQDGFPDFYRLDLNEDNKLDLYGFDDNQDGEIDRYSKR